MCHDRQKSRILILAVLLWPLLLVDVRGQDRVTHLPVGASKPITSIGDIMNFTGTELVLQTRVSLQRIPSDRIEQIETHYVKEHLLGREQFTSGETEASIQSLRQAIKSEPRAWVDREILALIVQAELRQQNLMGAMHDFQTILETDPATRHWGIAPMVWSPQVIPDALRVEMQRWLSLNSPSQHLLAASVLLLDPVQGERAEERLRELARNTEPIFSTYAKAQLWRLELASGRVHEESLQRWQEQMERLPKELRPGPHYLYSRGFEVMGDFRAAAGEALWIPFVYSNNEILAARALFEAGENLSRTGLNTEGKNLYRELIVRYPWSREAKLARGKFVETNTP